MVIPLAIIWAFLPNDGIAVVFHYFCTKVAKILADLPHSRKLETEADELGLFVMASVNRWWIYIFSLILFIIKACYDVREASTFWGRLSLLEERKNTDLQSGVQFLNTHPAHDQRQSFLDSIMAHAIQIRNERKVRPKILCSNLIFWFCSVIA